jgi:hypothetical protein
MVEIVASRKNECNAFGSKPAVDRMPLSVGWVESGNLESTARRPLEEG